MQIYIYRDNQQLGPYSIEEIKAYLTDGKVQAEDFAWHEGLTEWIPLSQVPGITTNPPPLPAAQQPEALKSAASLTSTLPALSLKPASGGLKRWVLFFGVNIVSVITICILINLLGVNAYLEGNGIDFFRLFVFSLVVGFVGAGISLFISKWMAIRIYNIKIVHEPGNETEKWLLATLTQQSRSAHIPTPELGLYASTEVNAFATGRSRKHSLVALSSGLLSQCAPDEVEAVIGHEIGHIAAGDMVTMTLLQGILNTFVIFISRVIGFFAARALASGGSKGKYWVQRLISFVCQIILGILASMILMSYSRRREFKADAFSAALRGKEAMINALTRLKDLSLENCPPDARGASLAAFKISGTKKRWFPFLNSHPPLEDRIAALKNLR